MTVLLVAHGSPHESARAVMRSWADGVCAELAGRRVDLCWLDHDVPSALEAVQILRGEPEVEIQPLLLLPGAHSEDDVPALARALAAQGSQVRVGRPIGPAPMLVDAVCDAVVARFPTSILLASSGTQRTSGRVAAAALAALLAERLRPAGVEEVHLGYVGSGFPHIAEARRRLALLSHHEPLVVPWFLADGHIRGKLGPAVAGLASLPPLGEHVLGTLVAVTVAALGESTHVPSFG